MDHGDLADLDAVATAERIASGAVSAAEVVEAAIERCSRIDGVLNSVVSETFDLARRLVAKGRDGPFAGVPMVVKDLESLAGQPRHLGNAALRRAKARAAVTDTSVRRLVEAGFVPIGKSNTPEFGLATATEPLSHGPCRNPWNPARSPGGSSGGSGAAVSAGIVPVGTASDGGGSIRIPASACGLVGLKPTRDRVPLGPEVAEAWAGLVVRGALVRSVRDAAAVLDVLGAPEHGAPHRAPRLPGPLSAEVGADPGRLRIGIAPDEWLAVAAAAEIAEVTTTTAELLAELGHEVEPSVPPGLDEDLVGVMMPAFGTWAAADVDRCAALVGRELGPDDFEEMTWGLALSGRETTPVAYLASIDSLHAWAHRVQQWWRPGPECPSPGFDLFLTPTLPSLPPAIGAGAEAAIAMPTFTLRFNVTGQPALSLPLGEVDGMPVGVQLVAAFGREDVLVRVGAQLEAARPWAQRRPALWAGR